MYYRVSSLLLQLDQVGTYIEPETFPVNMEQIRVRKQKIYEMVMKQIFVLWKEQNVVTLGCHLSYCIIRAFPIASSAFGGAMDNGSDTMEHRLE